MNMQPSPNWQRVRLCGLVLLGCVGFGLGCTAGNEPGVVAEPAGESGAGSAGEASSNAGNGFGGTPSDDGGAAGAGESSGGSAGASTSTEEGGAAGAGESPGGSAGASTSTEEGGAASKGGSSGSGGASLESGGTSSVGGTLSSGGSAGEPGTCILLATAEEIAETPRADFNLELMAIRYRDTESVVADQVTYDRLVRDMAVMRAEESELEDITYMGERGPGTSVLNLTLDSEASALAQAGDYHAWDCLNEGYGPASMDSVLLSPGTLLVDITFAGRYSMDEIALQYGALPGMVGAGAHYPTRPPQGFPTDICLSKNGPTWSYVFVEQYADESNPEDLVVYYFMVDADGNVTGSDVYYEAEDTVGVPEWFADFVDCPHLEYLSE
jgi:hypothetical protein